MKSNLKQIRKEAGLTLQQLADITGVSKSRLHGLERDTQNPSLETACIIARSLDNDVFSIWTCDNV